MSAQPGSYVDDDNNSYDSLKIDEMDQEQEQETHSFNAEQSNNNTGSVQVGSKRRKLNDEERLKRWYVDNLSKLSSYYF